jgi:hypothetical protein
MLSLSPLARCQKRKTYAKELGILNLPLGLSYKTWSNTQVSTSVWHSSGLGTYWKSIPKARYANPGSHCLTCVRKDCLEVYRG